MVEEICHNNSINSIHYIRHSFCSCSINAKLWLPTRLIIDWRCNCRYVFRFICRFLQGNIYETTATAEATTRATVTAAAANFNNNNNNEQETVISNVVSRYFVCIVNFSLPQQNNNKYST